MSNVCCEAEITSLTAQVKPVSAEMGLVLFLMHLAAVSLSQVGSTSTDRLQWLEPARRFYAYKGQELAPAISVS